MKAKLAKRWDMVNKGREKLVKNLDKMKEKITSLKNKEPSNDKIRLLAPEAPAKPPKRDRFAELETQIEQLKTLNADDSALNEEAKKN